MRPAMSAPMSVCHVTTLPPAFRHLSADAAACDLAVGCPETTRPADAGLHALGRPAEQQCTSIASSAALPTAEITLRYGCSAQKLRLRYFVFGRPYGSGAGSPARLSMGEQAAAG
jgi:hypothetical protein